MSLQWHERIRPARLERRYEFDDYEDLRQFLDKAADLSESIDLYPDLGFGRDYVNVTIHADEEMNTLLPRHREFADQLEKLAGDTTPAQE